MTEKEKLEEKLKKLRENYIGYLECDKNKEANRVLNNIYKLEEQIDDLNEIEKCGGVKSMSKQIRAYKKFIESKGLEYEFNNYLLGNEQEIEETL